MRFTVVQLCVVMNALARANAAALNSGPRDRLAQDLMDRGLIACAATDAHGATKRVPCSIWNEWGTSRLEEGSSL